MPLIGAHRNDTALIRCGPPDGAWLVFFIAVAFVTLRHVFAVADFSVALGSRWFWKPLGNPSLMPRRVGTALLHWYFPAAAQVNEWTKDQHKRLAKELETNQPPR